MQDGSALPAIIDQGIARQRDEAARQVAAAQPVSEELQMQLSGEGAVIQATWTTRNGWIDQETVGI